MGFLEYAWATSFQKDESKVRILEDPTINQPTLESDKFGFTIRLPKVQITEDGQIYFLGQKFKQDPQGRSTLCKLFRASVLHLTTHTLMPICGDKLAPSHSDSIVEAFAKSLVRDIYVYAYFQGKHADRCADLAFANALAFSKLKSNERIVTSATRVMSALLSKVNVGLVKGLVTKEEELAIITISNMLIELKKSFVVSLSGEGVDTEGEFDKNVLKIAKILEPFGPFLEAPSFGYTEEIGKCSVFAENKISGDPEIEEIFRISLKNLGRIAPLENSFGTFWGREHEIEAFQAFESEQHQKERRDKIQARISEHLSATKFRSVIFPNEDYTRYLRARALVQGGSRRVLDGLRSAQNLLDEDQGQEIGLLDLTAVIQALASKKPATDVFIKDEYLKQSFAWSIIFDASASMRIKGEYSRALAICIAEAAKELLKNPESWTMFAFSDKFYVLKDSSESYNRTVRSRIGGLEFDGLTFMPDAIYLAGRMLAKRFEEQRILVVISDGWPFGYSNMSAVLRKIIDDLARKAVIVIGIGVETENMGNYFRLNASVHTQKDLVKKFASIFIRASEGGLEAE
jgi:Mg-chelatase subunit ChlD